MKDLIKNALQTYKISFNDKQLEKLYQFSQIVLTENEKFNLTAITDPKEFVYKHILDSALAVNLFDENAKIIDIGSGAGFPGIVLKILRDDLTVLLVDSLQKRVNFLNNTIKALDLTNISATHERAEDLAANFLHREKFDFATARAVASLPTLLEYLLPFVKIGGKVIAYKATGSENEVEQSKNALHLLGGKYLCTHSFTIKEISASRNLIVVNKVSKTSSIYPRGKNKPKLSPL